MELSAPTAELKARIGRRRGHANRNLRNRRVHINCQNEQDSSRATVRKRDLGDIRRRQEGWLAHPPDRHTAVFAHFQLKRHAAAGVDGETWRHYGEALEENLQSLSHTLKRGAYRAKPVRRVYIPKADGLGGTALRRQAGSASDGGSAQRHLRNRLPRLLLWVPARTQPAYGAGRPVLRTPSATCELGAGSGRAQLFRPAVAHMAGPVSPTPGMPL